MGNSESKKIPHLPQVRLKSVEIHVSSRKSEESLCIKETYTKTYYLYDNCHFVAIYDGYGYYGGAAAYDASEALMTYFVESHNMITLLKSGKDVKYFIAEGLRKVHQKLSREAMYYNSGTCCIGALILKNKIFIFNIGNSRAALCTNVVISGFKTTELSHDHDLNSQEERTRILNKGLKIHKIQEDGHEFGPERIWINNEGPGITATRMLGNCQASHAIIPEPEIEEYDLSYRDSFLILGSDGLWNVMGTEEAVSLIYGRERGSEAVEYLVKEAKRKWKIKSNTEKYIIGDDSNRIQKTDDITAIVCYFNFPTTEEMEVLERFDFLYENNHSRLKSLKESLVEK